MIVSPSNRLDGVGEYYFSSKLKEVARLNSEGKNIINLGIGSPDLNPPSVAIETLKLESDKVAANGYQPYQGVLGLRTAIAAFYKTHYQVSLDPNSEILPLMGSKEGIMHISLAYLNPGDRVLIPELGYPTYTSVSRLVQANILYYPLDERTDWEPDWDSLESSITSDTKIIWLNYPHMPTGANGSSHTLRRFVELAHRKQVLLCHDNPYSFIRNERPLSIFHIEGAKEVAIELNSLSKTFNMAGWRVGWACGAADLLDPVVRVKSNMDSGMYKPLQMAAAEVMKLGKEWFQMQNEVYSRREKLALEFLDRIQCDYHPNQSGLFVWAKSRKGSGSDLCDRLLYEHEIFITPGEIFGTKGTSYVRVSLCQPESVFKEALMRLP